MKYFLISILTLSSIIGNGQSISFKTEIARLGMLLSNGASFESIEIFRDSVLNTTNTQLDNSSYRGFLESYVYWVSDQRRRPYKEISMSFPNDTLNQFGFLLLMQYQFESDQIDSAQYVMLSDSLTKKALHSALPVLIRNQKYHLNLSKKIPDFQYQLNNGDIYQLSESQDSFLLLEFPMPAFNDVRTPTGKTLFADYQNIKVLRISPFFGDSQSASDGLSPKNLDVGLEINGEIDAFFKIRSSPRWILINRNHEQIMPEIDLRKKECVEQIISLLSN